MTWRMLAVWLGGIGLCAGLLLSGCAGHVPMDGTDETSRALDDYIGLSESYLARGDLANAIRHLENAGRLVDKDARLDGLWALVHARQGDEDRAEKRFREALARDRDNPQLRNNYAVFLYERKHYKAAREQLEYVVREPAYERRAAAYENLGLVALALEDKEGARQAFRRSLRLDETRWRAHLALGELCWEQSRAREGRLHLRRARHWRRQQGRAVMPGELWLGVRLARDLDEREHAARLGRRLLTGFPEARETHIYRQSLTDE